MGSVYDGISKQVVGKVDSYGDVYNRINIRVGKVDSYGYIYNKSDKQVGRVDTYGNIYDNSDSQVGRVDSSNVIYNYEDKVVGNTEEYPFNPIPHDQSQAAYRRGAGAFLLVLFFFH